MKEIKRVEVVLENVDVIVLDVKEIDYLEFGDLNHIISYPSYEPTIIANSFIMKLNSQANRDYRSVFTSSFPDDNYNIFYRLGSGDVTRIDLYDQDDKEYTYYIDWSGDNPNYSLAQFSFVGNGEEFLFGSNLQKYADSIQYFKERNEC